MTRLERFLATMVFCEAPLDGTTFALAPTGGDTMTKRDAAFFRLRVSSTSLGASPIRGSTSMARLERFLATMAFCEAPLGGTFPPLVPTGDTVKRHTRGDDYTAGKKKMKPVLEKEKERGVDRVAQFMDAVALD